MDFILDSQTILAAAFVVIVVCLILIQVFFFSPHSQQLDLHQLVFYPQFAALVELESGDQDVDKHAGDEQPDQPFQFQPCALSACHRSVSTGF